MVPGHPSKHGANTEPGRSRPMRRRSSPPPGRALPAVRNAGPEVASAMDTIRNLASIGNAAGRREMDLPYTCLVPRTYPQVGGTGGGAARTTGAGAAAMPVPYGHRRSHDVAGQTASRSGRSSAPSRSPQYRRGVHPHRGAPRLIGASCACPPRAAGIWWNPVFWVGVHGGSHRGEGQP